MKHWQESSLIFGRMAGLLESGGSAVLATIISIQGSTYRRPGARLLITESGRDVGNVSGGCLEEDIVETAREVLRERKNRVAVYDTSDAEDLVFGMGLGCNGKVELLLQPVFPESLPGVKLVCSRLAGTLPFTLLQDPTMSGFVPLVVDQPSGTPPGARQTPVGGWDVPVISALVDVPGFGDRVTGMVKENDKSFFLEQFIPPPVMAVCGAGDDAIPLVRLAAEAGFRVWVLDHRAAYLSGSRFPSAFRVLKWNFEDAVPPELAAGGQELFVVIKTHALRHDRGCLKAFSTAGPRYVGILGPRTRCAELAAEADSRIRPVLFGPVGLDLGGEGPEQIALSTVAESIAVYNGRPGSFLRDRSGSIHTPPPG